MQLLVFTEKDRTRKAIEDYFRATSHKLDCVDLASLTSLKDLSVYGAIITDHKTWQENSAILRYFGLIGTINTLPLMVFRESGKQQKLKFRDINHHTVVCNFALNSDEVQSFLEQLLETSDHKD